MTNEHSKTNYRGTEYIHCAYNMEMRKVVLDKIVQMIRRSGVQFDTIVFRGMSGCLIGPSVADILNKPFLMVRKENDGSHSSHDCEGHADINKFIIIDDLICSGATIDSINRTFASEMPDKAQSANCVAIFLYNQSYAEMYYRNTPIYACKSEKLKTGQIIVREYTRELAIKYPGCYVKLIEAENQTATAAYDASYNR